MVGEVVGDDVVGSVVGDNVVGDDVEGAVDGASVKELTAAAISFRSVSTVDSSSAAWVELWAATWLLSVSTWLLSVSTSVDMPWYLRGRQD